MHLNVKLSLIRRKFKRTLLNFYAHTAAVMRLLFKDV